MRTVWSAPAVTNRGLRTQMSRDVMPVAPVGPAEWKEDTRGRKTMSSALYSS